MPRLMKITDVIISRAGASTMSEIMALAIPTIFIPSPYVPNNHQFKNAYDLVSKDAACMLEEKDLTPDNLIKMIDELLNKCAVVMKLLYLEDLKQIQIKANKIIVAVQVCIFRAGTMHVGVHWKPKCQCGCSSTIRRVVLQFVVILLFLCEYLVVLLWIIDQNT